MKRKPETKNVEPRKFADGESVIILRPHLWSGCSGTVISFSDGLHRLKIDAKDGEAYPSSFTAEAPGSLLESFI